MDNNFSHNLLSYFYILLLSEHTKGVRLRKVCIQLRGIKDARLFFIFL